MLRDHGLPDDPSDGGTETLGSGSIHHRTGAMPPPQHHSSNTQMQPIMVSAGLASIIHSRLVAHDHSYSCSLNQSMDFCSALSEAFFSACSRCTGCSSQSTLEAANAPQRLCSLCPTTIMFTLRHIGQVHSAPRICMHARSLTARPLRF